MNQSARVEEIVRRFRENMESVLRPGVTLGSYLDECPATFWAAIVVFAQSAVNEAVAGERERIKQILLNNYNDCPHCGIGEHPDYRMQSVIEEIERT